MPPNRRNTYETNRERMLNKLHARQPPSECKKFVVGSDEDTLPPELKTTIEAVLKVKYSNNMAAYPECKFKTIDVLWCQPPNTVEIKDGSDSNLVVPWNRTRFYIEYRRAYGMFTIDFLQYEILPKDFSEPQISMDDEAACTVDITFRKIAMEFTCSKNEHQGAGRGNSKSNFFGAIYFAVHGWINIDNFAANDAFRMEVVKRTRKIVDIRAENQNNLTRPLVFLKVNADEIPKIVNVATYQQLDTIITTLPMEGKTMRMKHTPAEKAQREAEMEEMMANVSLE